MKQFELKGIIHSDMAMYDTEYHYELRFSLKDLPQELQDVAYEALKNHHGRWAVNVSCNVIDVQFQYEEHIHEKKDRTIDV